MATKTTGKTAARNPSGKSQQDDPEVPLHVVLITPADRRALSSLCESYRETSEAIADLDKDKKALRTKIEDIVERNHLTKVRGPGWLLVRKTKKTTAIAPEILLSLGVSLATIKKATKVTESKPYITVLGVENAESEE